MGRIYCILSRRLPRVIEGLIFWNQDDQNVCSCFDDEEEELVVEGVDWFSVA